MDISRFVSLFSLATAVPYFIVAVYAGFKQSFREQREGWLVVYLIVSGLWTLGMVLFALSSPAVSAVFALYGPFLLAILLYYLTRSFLHLPVLVWRVGVAGLSWLVIVAAFQLGGRLSSAELVLRLAMLIGWMVVMGATAVITARDYWRRQRQPLHRNRLQYWVWGWLITAVADLLIFAQIITIGTSLRLIAALLIVYVMGTNHLLDVRRIQRRLVSYLVVTLLLGGVYLVGLYVVLPTTLNPVVASVGLTMLLLVMFTPLLRTLQYVVDQLTAGSDYDPNRMLREYSMSINSIVDLSQLETAVVRLVNEAMDIRYGTLYLVDIDAISEARPVYQLSSVQGFGEENLVLGSFDVDSAVASWLLERNQPLTQYDIDLLPRFQNISETEREWLAGIGMDVYVPIHNRGRWIGVIGLGPKASGDRYFENDLLLMSTLADQTAVALENARLIDDLVRVNRDLQEAQTYLKDANHQLQESDKLKSSFISVVTHELRTPFAGLGFSLEILQQHGLDNLTTDQKIEFANLVGGIGKARRMVDNLVAFATFISKQGQLEKTHFDFFAMVTDTLRPLQPLAESKTITFDILQPSSAWVHGDKERLSEVVYHLIHNAIKFTPDNGKIWIRTELENSHLQFEVQDTGRGIPEDRLDGLWEGFTQMADPVKRGVEGLGVGLPLARSIVQEHGGDVFAHSREGAGSAFGFCLPLNGNKKQAPVIPDDKRLSLLFQKKSLLSEV